jgi:hypothetical protein
VEPDARQPQAAPARDALGAAGVDRSRAHAGRSEPCPAPVPGTFSTAAAAKTAELR